MIIDRLINALNISLSLSYSFSNFKLSFLSSPLYHKYFHCPLLLPVTAFHSNRTYVSLYVYAKSTGAFVYRACEHECIRVHSFKAVLIYAYENVLCACMREL